MISTLQAMLRQTPAFLTATMAAAIATTIGLFGLLLASFGFLQHGQLRRRRSHA